MDEKVYTNVSYSVAEVNDEIKQRILCKTTRNLVNGFDMINPYASIA